jgi:hypothetical protein
VLDGGLWRAITARTERAVELHRAVAYGGCSGRQLRARALVISDLRDGRARSARHLALVAGALKSSAASARWALRSASSALTARVSAA